MLTEEYWVEMVTGSSCQNTYRNKIAGVEDISAAEHRLYRTAEVRYEETPVFVQMNAGEMTTSRA